MTARGGAAVAGGVFLLLLALFHVALTASTVASSSLVHPAFDQFRLNHRYLSVDFPLSILQLENGHRPILPGLVRWIELREINGDQVIQSVTAWLAALVTVALVVREVWRGLPNFLLRAAAMCAATTLLIWNANARMLIHPYEAVHVFYVMGGVLLAILAATRGWWLAALAASVLATFSFGTGIASFAAVMTIACLQHRNLRVLGMIVLATVVTFIVYFWILPGAEGVRNATAAPDMRGAVLFLLLRVGAVFAELTRLFLPHPGVTSVVALLAGAIITGAMVGWPIMLWRRKHEFRPVEALGIALFAFAFAANTLIAVTRTPFFFEHADQVFADRYLYWSCVGTAGVFLFLLARLAQAGSGLQTAGAAFAGLFALACLIPAAWCNAWSVAVFREVELANTGLRLGIRVDEQVAKVADGESEAGFRLIEQYRRSAVGEFKEHPAIELGSRLSVQGSEAPEARLSLKPIHSTHGGHPVYQVTVLVPAMKTSRGARMWILDGNGVVVGAASVAFPSRHPVTKLRLGVPDFDGVEGYVVDVRPPLALAVDSGEGEGLLIARLVP